MREHHLLAHAHYRPAYVITGLPSHHLFNPIVSNAFIDHFSHCQGKVINIIENTFNPIDNEDMNEQSWSERMKKLSIKCKKKKKKSPSMCKLL